MELTKQDLQNYIYDPNKVQKLILEYLEECNSDNLAVIDPTNPFTMLLEAAAVTASNATVEINNIERKLYPSLANKEDDLYHHITDNELTSMFAVPAECSINFYVNVVDMKASGYRPDGANYVQTTIPKGTSIVVIQTATLTLLNDITVRLYDNGAVDVEQVANPDNDLAYDDIGTLQGNFIYTSLTSGLDQTPWIMFTTKIKQVKKYTVNQALNSSTGFSTVVNITDKYCYASISYKNNNTNGMYKYISKTHSEDYIDPQTPTCFISIYDKNILFKIPPVYLTENMISGNINIDVYDTIGNIYLPIDKYTPVDFAITLGDTTANPSTLSSKKIAILADSKAILDGGKDNFTLDELRDSIINNTTGDIDLPITNYQINRLGELSGFNIVKATDTITNRTYYAVKSLPDLDNSGLVYAKADIFVNTCRMILEDIKDLSGIISNEDRFIIKSNNIFKVVNGVTTILSQEQLDYLANLDNIKLINHLATNKYFFNPFYYIVTLDENYATSKVYDLDHPDITNNRILAKNNTVSASANINKYGIIKSSTGYRLIVTLSPNTDFSNLEEGSVKLQLKLPLYGNTSYAYIDSSYDKVNGVDRYAFDINTNLAITTDNLMDLENGSSDIATKLMELAVDATIYIISTDASILDPSKFLQDEIYINDNKKYTVFTKEELSITFGTELKYLYNNLYNVYSARKYKTYTADIPMTYTSDVYEPDPITGTIFNVKNGQVEYNIIHNAGDQVFDNKGKPVYIHKKGDNVLDDSGNPVIDTSAGIIRYIDVLLFEYEYYRANASAYVTYKDLITSTVKQYVTSELENINTKLLENTIALYRSYKSANDITIIVNDNYNVIPYAITPSVTLYMSNTTVVNSSLLDEYRNTIGNIINTYLDNNVLVMEEIKGLIKDSIGSNITGVKITGIDPSNAEVISIKDANRKLVLNKALTVNKNNEYIVIYDIKLNIQYI